MAERFLINDQTTWGYFNDTPNRRPMGLGLLTNPGLVFKRKFRWTLAIQYCLNDDANIKSVSEEFVKMASRPQLDIDETEINFLNGKFWIPGKVTPQAMNVTYYDLAGTPTGLPDSCDDAAADANLACFPCDNNIQAAFTSNSDNGTLSVFNWIASIYDITDPCRLKMGSKTGDYQGEGLLRLYDGCGNTVEAWLMQNMFPTSINFGELDMSSSDECTIELTLRYSSIAYRTLCPETTLNPCPCSDC